jgi:predicted enzyme related to lactoylglutathione lyase
MTLTGLVPMLPVRSMPARVEFYEKVLGFSVEGRNDEWGWATLSHGECRLMLDQSINAQPDAPRQTIVYLYPDDVAAYHDQVRRSGFAVPELHVTFYGMTEFRIEDPDGNRLWIGRALPTES